MEKIFVGSLDDKQKMSGVYFDDSQFAGLPSVIRVPFDHWTPRGEYDDATSSYIPDTLRRVDMSAWSEDAVQYALKAPDPNIKAIMMGNIKLMNVWVIIPDKDNCPKEFNAVKSVVNKIDDGFDKNPNKDLLLTGCVCHVIPLGAQYGNFKGMQLALYNLDKVKVSFVDALKA